MARTDGGELAAGPGRVAIPECRLEIGGRTWHHDHRPPKRRTQASKAGQSCNLSQMVPKAPSTEPMPANANAAMHQRSAGCVPRAAVHAPVKGDEQGPPARAGGFSHTHPCVRGARSQRAGTLHLGATDRGTVPLAGAW